MKPQPYKTVLGIDIGGTKIDLGLVSDGQVIQKHNFKIGDLNERKSLLDGLVSAIKSFDVSEIQAIGIGVPGIVDPGRGFVLDLQNIPLWFELPLADLLEKEFQRPIKLNNDANCFALGHAHFDVGKKWRNFAALTLGTGLGMGMIINGELYSGLMSGAGEIGMVPYRDGIVEDYAASQFFVRQFGMSAEKLHQMALDGDPMAFDAFSQYGNELGNALKIVMSMMAPEGIVLGGSIAKAHEFFWSSMIMSLEHFEYRAQLNQTSVVTSEHSDIALLGAAALCWA